MSASESLLKINWLSKVNTSSIVIDRVRNLDNNVMIGHVMLCTVKSSITSSDELINW